MKPTNLELHIEELVLHGFPARDRHRIGDTVQKELAALLAEHGVPQSVGQSKVVVNLDCGHFNVVQNVGIEAIGEQVAKTVYGGLV